MQNQLVFQEQTEIERLAVQNRLRSRYEMPVVEQILSGGCGKAVLDIGCNDGQKTVRLFGNAAVSRVIGLEYNEKLALQAQKRFGNDKFSFHPCDVEGADFAAQLETLCGRAGVSKFDVIYLSFVLMHLSAPEKLLGQLKPFLKDTGRLLVIEPHDRVSLLEPDPGKLLPEFLDILEQDPYAGNRHVGAKLPQLLKAAGYGDVKRWNDGISAGAGDPEQKKDIFHTFFSYLPEDVQILRSLEPENRRYQAWHSWLQDNYRQLETEILQKDSHIFMGLQMISCRKENDDTTVLA